MERRRSLTGKRIPRRTALYNYLKPSYPRFRPDYRGRTSQPSPPTMDTQAVHQRWQMDFKGRESIAPEGQVPPWLVCDEFSSAPLAGIIYTKRTGEPKAGLSCRDLQANLRQVFTEWGLPDQLRMDRDPLFVSNPRLEWPGTLLLWLVGLGITPIINRPGRPTDNANVERLGRTWHEHVGYGADSRPGVIRMPRPRSPLMVKAATGRRWSRPGGSYLSILAGADCPHVSMPDQIGTIFRWSSIVPEAAWSASRSRWSTVIRK
jgi:transposase InsO family protein